MEENKAENSEGQSDSASFGVYNLLDSHDGSLVEPIVRLVDKQIGPLVELQQDHHKHDWHDREQASRGRLFESNPRKLFEAQRRRVLAPHERQGNQPEDRNRQDDNRRNQHEKHDVNGDAELEVVNQVEIAQWHVVHFDCVFDGDVFADHALPVDPVVVLQEDGHRLHHLFVN